PIRVSLPRWRCGSQCGGTTQTAGRRPWERGPMGLIEHVTEERLQREAAAGRLRDLADQLARHNQVAFVRDGIRYTVDVPDEVTFTLEIEVGEDGSEVEVELKW